MEILRTCVKSAEARLKTLLSTALILIPAAWSFLRNSSHVQKNDECLRKAGCLAFVHKLIAILAILFCGILSQVANSLNADETHSCLLTQTGQLECDYSSGIILPLKCGKILALSGRLDPSERSFTDSSNNSFTHGRGMVEVFDPQSCQNKFLGQLPFALTERMGPIFANQGQAVELDDGRILLVGEFIESNDAPLYSQKQKLNRWVQGQPHEPRFQLVSIAPVSQPNLFGLLYDWKSGKVELVKTTEDLPPRHSVAMQLLSDGDVLITGGSVSASVDASWNLFPENSILLFNPTTLKLKKVGSLKHSRSNHRMIPLDEKRFLLFGGWGPSESEAQQIFCDRYNPDGTCGLQKHFDRTREVELYDFNSNSSSTVGHTCIPRSDFSMVALPRGDFFITGGEKRIHTGLSNAAAELYNSVSNVTSIFGTPVTPTFANGMANHEFLGENADSQCVKTKENLFVCNGISIFIFNLESLKLSQYERCELKEPRRNFRLIQVNNRVFVIGGHSITSRVLKNLIEEVHESK